jgi:hypothetical protein
MSRYDWPNDLRKDPETKEGRAEASHSRVTSSAVPGALGDLSALSDVIEANFEPDRQWMPLGPTILRRSQSATSGTVAGRVRDLVVHSDGAHAYAGVANGGIWVTKNGGDSWKPLGSWDLAPDTDRSGLILTVGALLVEWGETRDQDVIYVGTGELAPTNSDNPGGRRGGIGVLRLAGSVGEALAAQGGNAWQREGQNLAGLGIYRLAREPAAPPAQTTSDAARLVAATSQGLFFRNGAFEENSDWVYHDVTNGAFDREDYGKCTDVLWTEDGLFVAVVDVEENVDGVWFSRNWSPHPDDVENEFERIALPAQKSDDRICFAASPVPDAKRIYVSGTAMPDVDETAGFAAGWLIDLDHTPPPEDGDDPIAAFKIDNWPIGVYASSVTRQQRDSSADPDDPDTYTIERSNADYNNAITVVEDGGNDVVFVGGSGSGRLEAHIYRLAISGSAAGGDLDAGFSNDYQATKNEDTSASLVGTPFQHQPTWAGKDIHADVHALRPAGSTVWVGCDGGVYTRPNQIAASNDAGTSRNVGLPTTEPGYIESHPTLDGHMIAGLQDNGTIEWVGGGVWQRRGSGDGGGCAYHPTRPGNIVRQYIRAGWSFRPRRDPEGPAMRSRKNWASEEEEDGRSSFYSSPLAMKGLTETEARLFIGTDRIWMTEDWYVDPTRTDWMTWHTIPSVAEGDPHPIQTAADESAITGTDDAAEAASTAANSDNNINQDRLRHKGREDPVLVIEAMAKGAPALDFQGTKIAVLCERTVRIFELSPDPLRWTAIEDSVISGKPPSCSPNSPPDPSLEFLPQRSGVTWTDIAPDSETTLYVSTSGRAVRDGSGDLEGDPDFDTLWWYNGDGRWYPTGLRNAAPNPTTGQAGTPTAAFSVLVDWNSDDPDAGNNDIVWVGTRIGVFEGRIDHSGEHPSWTWRPIMDGLPQTIAEDLSLFSSADGERRYLRAALVSLGIWERDVSPVPHSVGHSYIRSVSADTGRGDLPDPFRSPVIARRGSIISVSQSPDILVYPTTRPPGDLNEHYFTLNERLAGASSLPRSGFAECHVQVHHRHTTPLPPSDLRVSLFILQSAFLTQLRDIAVDDALRTALLDAPNGGPQTDVFNSSDLNVRFIETRNPSHPLFARRPGVVSFASIDLSWQASGIDYLTMLVMIDPTLHPLTPAELSPRAGETTLNLDQVMRRSAYFAVQQHTRR